MEIESEIDNTPEKPPEKRAKIQPYIDYNPQYKNFYYISNNKALTLDQLNSEVKENGLYILTDTAKNDFLENIAKNESPSASLSYQSPSASLSYQSPSASLSYQSQPQSFQSPPQSQASFMSTRKPIGELVRTNLFKQEKEDEVTKMQNYFNSQDPQLLSKEAIAQFYTKFNSYWQTQPKDRVPVADPEKCFTFLEIESNLLFDVLNLSKMCYIWRGKSSPMFGISGELSIAGLTILAMKTLRVICKSKTLIDIKKLKAKGTDSISWTHTDEFLANFQSYFDDAFKNIDSKKREGETRDNLDSVHCKLLTTLMLNVMDEFKKNYYQLKKIFETTINQQYLDFLVDSFLLLERLVLIKSSLDVTQAEGLNELVIYDSFCLFNSYDYSAVLNTPYCPVLASGRFSEFEEINYIYDDIAIFEFFYITKTPQEEYYKLPDVAQKIFKIFESYRLTGKTFYIDIDVSFSSEKSSLFINAMNTEINGKSVYQHLWDLAAKNISSDFDVSKLMYESVSKLFLNYNSSRGVLNFQEITSNSRDIRAHDYANSPIRFFGISIYIKKKINDFLIIKKINVNNRLNQLENDVEIINILNGFDYKTKNELANFILEDESLSIQIQYKTRTRVDSTTNETIIQENISKIKLFLLDKSYNPLEGFIQEIKDIYILMCGQDAEKFESSQEIDGLKRVTVYELNEKGDKGEERVLLNKGPLFRKGAQFSEQNKANAEILRPVKSYIFSEKTIGIADLCIKRGGVNRIIHGKLVETTITEADAAHASLGFYTKKIHIHKNGELFLNRIKLATVFSGDYIGKYDKQKEKMDTSISSFSLLFGLTKFNITAFNAIQTIQYLISNEVQNNINKYIDGISEINNDLGVTIRNYYNTLITQIQGFLDSKPKKAGLAKNVYDSCYPLIRVFIQNVNTTLDQYIKENPNQTCNVGTLINKIGEELYYILILDNDKFFMLVEKPESSREMRVKRGGGKDEYECLIENNQTETKTPVNLFRGKFGSYIDVENGEFVFKEIHTEEELKNIEMRLGIIDDSKEKQIQTTPIKTPINTTFQSPTSVEELKLSPPEKKQRITEEINEGINEEINGGKTIKRRRRIKRKTRRIKNKSKHRKTVKLMKKRAKMTKGRKPRH
jgi:hypothetical protein